MTEALLGGIWFWSSSMRRAGALCMGRMSRRGAGRGAHRLPRGRVRGSFAGCDRPAEPRLPADAVDDAVKTVLRAESQVVSRRTGARINC